LDFPDGSMWKTHLCKEYSINVHNTIPDTRLNIVGKKGEASETQAIM
jgi:hypothetical protein